MPPIRFKIRPLDLHHKKHADVPVLVEDYVLANQYSRPLQIITGNSETMRTIVTKTLKAHHFKYSIGDSLNKGYIVVL